MLLKQQQQQRDEKKQQTGGGQTTPQRPGFQNCEPEARGAMIACAEAERRGTNDSNNLVWLLRGGNRRSQFGGGSAVSSASSASSPLTLPSAPPVSLNNLAPQLFLVPGAGGALITSSQQPWSPTKLAALVEKLPTLFGLGLLRQLKITVDSYVECITPSEKERNAKRTLFNAFADFLRHTMAARIGLSVAGSTAYEVDAKGSDLDVVLLTNYGAPLYVLQNIVQILQLAQSVQQRSSKWPLKNVQLQLVESARVPVLSITTPKGLVCDVSVNTLNSVKHTEYFKRTIRLNTALRPLMRLLKYWAKVRRLPTMKEGGLPGIVWMILAVYFGSCPLQTFLKCISPVTDEEDYALMTKLMPALDEMVPLFAALFRFFRLCGSRETLGRTISVSSSICLKKNGEEVSSRVASSVNHCGVWDEVVSLEDPAVVTEPTPPLNTWWGSREDTDANTVLKRLRFTPGSASDLAAKISSATWLVYLLELKRGSIILTRLLHFMLDARLRVENLPDILTLLENDAGGGDPVSPASQTSCCPSSALGDTSRGAARGGPPQSTEEYIARRLRQHVAFLFEESFSDRYVLPGCDEKLRQLNDDQQQQTGSSSGASDNASVDIEWEAAQLSATGRRQLSFHPFVTCCSQPRTEFAVVLLHGRLHLLRISSICTDWTSWWTKDFLSRRDVRSVIHGTLYQMIGPNEYLQYEQDRSSHLKAMFFHVDLPPSGFPLPRDQEESPTMEGLSDTRSPYPYLSLPVRRMGDSIPVEILFNPCNFVCRLRGWRIPPNSGTLKKQQPSSFDSTTAEFHTSRDDVIISDDDVFSYFESDEVNYLRTLAASVQEAPWWSHGESQQESAPTAERLTFQAAPYSCSSCGMDGDDLENIYETAGYRCSEGAFQTQFPAASVEVMKAAWKRWARHVQYTGINCPLHRYQQGTVDNEVPQSTSIREDESTSPVRGRQRPGEPPPIVAELSRAAKLLAAAIEALQQQQAAAVKRSSSSGSGSLFWEGHQGYRRTVSLPDRLSSAPPLQTGSKEEGVVSPEMIATQYQHPSIMGGVLPPPLPPRKRTDLERYVPPSKRELNTNRRVGPNSYQPISGDQQVPSSYDRYFGTTRKRNSSTAQQQEPAHYYYPSPRQRNIPSHRQSTAGCRQSEEKPPPCGSVSSSSSSRMRTNITPTAAAVIAPSSTASSPSSSLPFRYWSSGGSSTALIKHQRQHFTVNPRKSLIPSSPCSSSNDPGGGNEEGSPSNLSLPAAFRVARRSHHHQRHHQNNNNYPTSPQLRSHHHNSNVNRKSSANNSFSLNPSEVNTSSPPQALNETAAACSAAEVRPTGPSRAELEAPRRLLQSALKSTLSRQQQHSSSPTSNSNRVVSSKARGAVTNSTATTTTTTSTT